MPSLTASLNSGTAGPSLSAIRGCGIALSEVRKCHQQRALRPAARRAAVPVALALTACLVPIAEESQVIDEQIPSSSGVAESYGKVVTDPA